MKLPRKDRNKSVKNDETRRFEVATASASQLIEQYFDREADALELGELVQRLAWSSQAWQEIAETQHIIDELSAPVPCPDFTEAILRELESDSCSAILPPVRKKPGSHLRLWGSAAAVLVLALTLGIFSRVFRSRELPKIQNNASLYYPGAVYPDLTQPENVNPEMAGASRGFGQQMPRQRMRRNHNHVMVVPVVYPPRPATMLDLRHSRLPGMHYWITLPDQMPAETLTNGSHDLPEDAHVDVQFL